MTDHPLIAFLRARLDEREALARAAIDGWNEWIITVAADCYMDPEAEYIRQNGPAHVLREVEADRKLLDAHVGYYGAGDDEFLPIPTLSILAEKYGYQEA